MGEYGETGRYAEIQGCGMCAEKDKRIAELETVLQQAYDFIESVEPQGHIGLRHSDMRSKILDVRGEIT